MDQLLRNFLVTSGGRRVDPYFEYTTLLLPGNGANAQTNSSFTDASSNNFPITRYGNTTQGTFSPFSQTGWGNYFSGSSQYLTAPSNSAFNLGTNDFTIECWVYLTAYSVNWSGYYTASIISRDANTGASSGRNYWVNLNGTSSSWTGLAFAFFSGSTLSLKNESYAFSLNTWYNIAVVRSSGEVKFYVNGSLVGSGTTMSSAPNTNAIPLYIGQQGFSTLEYYFPGYISNLRLVNGVAVYTGNFTPPTSALTATQSAGTNISAITGTQTSLLTCQSNRFRDASTNNFTITVNGSPSVQAFSPFNPTSSWSAVTNGGSGYFDGTEDYLTTTITGGLGSGDFTMECWVYKVSLTNVNNSLMDFAPGLVLGYTSTTVYLYYGSMLINPTVTVPLNSWFHVAAVKNGGTLTLYVNGSSIGTYSDSNNYSDQNLYIGRDKDGNNDINAYVSNARIVKGTAVYTANFTPPTSPVTAISGTAFLLNFTNAGIYDATSKNDLETVDGAKISTAQSKWGGSSMYFDGTGDYLIVNPQNLLNFGTGDFTIEAWIYTTNNATFQAIFTTAADTFSSNTDWGILLDIGSTGAGILRGLFYNGNNSYSVASASTVVSTNTWTHVAFVKESGNIAIYYGTSGTGNRASTTSANFAPNFSSSWKPKIGYAQSSTTRFFNGYIQDLRISNTARYTGSTYTVPTAAFPTL